MLDRLNAFNNTPKKEEKPISTPPKPEKINLHIEDRIQEFRDMFELFDDENTGKISRDALKHLLDAVGLACDDSTAEEMTRKIDHTNRGTITFQKFISWAKVNIIPFETEVEPETAEAMTEHIFNLCENGDENGKNNVVTHRDLRNALQKINIPLSDDAVTALIMEADRDGNGCVERSEFSAMLNKHLGAYSTFNAHK